jgi:hypothetical protein
MVNAQQHSLYLRFEAIEHGPDNFSTARKECSHGTAERLEQLPVLGPSP